MVGVNKNKLGDILKKIVDPKAEEAKKTTTAAASTPKAKNTIADVKAAEEKLKAVQASGIAQMGTVIKKQEEVLHTKIHQDLINASYKAAEKLGISPWEILKEEWGNFTNTRGNKYTGPAIDNLKHLNDAQKKALKEVLGL